MTFDEHGNCTSMTKTYAKEVVRNMLYRDKDFMSPDFCMFTVPQRVALAELIGGAQMDDYDR